MIYDFNLYVIRHGEAPSNVLNIVSGWSKEGLTEKGIGQVYKMKNELKDIKFDVVFSSPLERTEQTAKIIIPNNKIIFDKRLIERDTRPINGMSRNNLDKSEWYSLKTEKTKEGIETLLAGLKRTKSLLEEIEKNYKNKNILMVTHHFNSLCIWMLVNNITDEKEIKKFSHRNGEIKHYTKKLDNYNI